MTTPENKTLFLGDLSRFCTEIELEELFSQHGQVLETKISRTSTGISLGYGFICMAERGQAEEAMKNLVGVVLSGRPLRIDWAARNVRDNNSYASNNNMINSIHVRYHTLQVVSSNCQSFSTSVWKSNLSMLQFSQRMDGLFTEETLKRFFEAYGKVVDVSIKNSSMDQVTWTLQVQRSLISESLQYDTITLSLGKRYSTGLWLRPLWKNRWGHRSSNFCCQ